MGVAPGKSQISGQHTTAGSERSYLTTYTMGKDDTKKEEMLGAVAIKPPGWDRTGLEAFRYFLYDPDNGTILSRTPKSWALITIFYCIYYSCLAAFWYVCLLIFFSTLPDAELGPKWQRLCSRVVSCRVYSVNIRRVQVRAAQSQEQRAKKRTSLK